MVVCTQKRFY